MWGQYHPTYTPPWLYAMSCCCVNTNINISIKKNPSPYSVHISRRASRGAGADTRNIAE